MDQELLKTFVILCENKNITKTAELLFKTQPTISGRIKTLEDFLGYSLIIRSRGKKNIEITERGLHFLQIAEKFLDLYDEINAAQEYFNRTLFISSISSISSPIIADICNELMQKEKQANITLYTHQTSEAYTLIAEKKLDIAFVAEAREEASVICEPAFSQKFYAARYCESPLGIQSVHSSDLDVNYEIYQRWSDHFAAWHERVFDKKHPHISIDSTALLPHFLTDSRYWTILQKSNLMELSKYIPLQIYEFLDPPPPRMCYMLTNQYMDRKNIYMINLLKTILKQYAFTNDIMPI